MYERFYGLRERPFNLTSNPRYLLLTTAHTEALSSLQYGLATRIGIIVLVGEAGTGKTTVLRAAMASQPAGHYFVLINNPLLSRSEFFQQLAEGFGLGFEAANSKTRFLSELTHTLERRVREGRRTSLIVDEAHALPYELLEEIRLLANIETDDEKLLPVVLAGQPELAERLNKPDLRQLKQRVALRCALRPLVLREAADYIAGRTTVAGGEAARLFTAEAVRLIYRYSGGVPRTISVICDNALVAGFAADERPVDADTVREVCRDLDLTMTEMPAFAAPRVQSAPAQSASAGEPEPTRAVAGALRRLLSL
jgi:general secretion pathway protein A